MRVKQVAASFALSLFCIFSVNASALPQWPQVLHWGYFNFPPLLYTDQAGRLTGPLAERVKRVLENANVPYQTIEYPNKRTKLMMNDGRINFNVMAKSFLIDPQSNVISDFPILETSIGVYWQAGTAPLTSLDDLQGKSVILISGFSYGEIRQQIESSALNIKSAMEVENHARGLQALLFKRADYFLGYTEPSNTEIETQSLQGISSMKVGAVDVYMIVSREMENADKLMRRLENSYKALYEL
ncbi:substrate-binding periplasmic protein [Alteromonas facilis]|uniref:substrate-binding periplasmic protein n=1 Tax=Alteromonas facilis TaxID=2048004 RepID=UPI000C28AA79|nr:transporter substrate-binding domain-containing protein [Alteromonas facilis]